MKNETIFGEKIHKDSLVRFLPYAVETLSHNIGSAFFIIMLILSSKRVERQKKHIFSFHIVSQGHRSGERNHSSFVYSLFSHFFHEIQWKQTLDSYI